MRCPDCNKFVSMENGEPEVNSVEVDSEGHVNAEVHLTRNCAECSTELKDYTFELEADPDEEFMAAHKGHALDVDEGDCSVDESGGGRYAKNIISVSLVATVKCAVCPDAKTEVELGSDAAASEFEECC